jgi:hypothetical protein
MSAAAQTLLLCVLAMDSYNRGYDAANGELGSVVSGSTASPSTPAPFRGQSKSKYHRRPPA